MKSQQIEIPLAGPSFCRPIPRNFRRTVRARWWFSQMRRVVDEATDPVSAETVRDEQIRLQLAGSQA